MATRGYPWLPVANVAPWLNRQGVSHIKIDPGATELQNQIWCQATPVYLATEPWSYGVSFGSQTTPVYLATEPP